MTATIKMECSTCGGFDLCNMNGTFIERHECVHPNIILLRIAEALETIAKGN